MSDRTRRTVLGLTGIVLAVAVWELAVVTGTLDEQSVPKPSTVFPALVDLLGTRYLWTHVGETASGAGLGLLIGCLIGITLGVAMGANRYAYHAFRPTVEFLRPVPGLALLPLALVIWGPTRNCDVFVVAFGSTWPMLLQTLNGMHALDDVGLMTARSMRLGWAQRVRWLYLPGTLPYVVTGVRLCVSLALVVAIGAEIVGGSPGLGREIRLAQGALDLDKMYSLVLMTGLLGLSAVLAANELERRALRWRPPQSGAS